MFTKMELGDIKEILEQELAGIEEGLDFCTSHGAPDEIYFEGIHRKERVAHLISVVKNEMRP